MSTDEPINVLKKSLASNCGTTSTIIPRLYVLEPRCLTLNQNSVLPTTGQNYWFRLYEMHNYQIISILSKEGWSDTETVALHIFYAKIQFFRAFRTKFLPRHNQIFCLSSVRVCLAEICFHLVGKCFKIKSLSQCSEFDKYGVSVSYGRDVRVSMPPHLIKFFLSKIKIKSLDKVFNVASLDRFWFWSI